MANGVNVAERYRGYAREGMSESEIQEQADRELKEKQKSDVSGFKGQAAEAKAMDKQQKAQLQANLIKAGVDSAMMAGQAIADSPGMQAKQANRKSTKLNKRADRMTARGADAGRIQKVRTRSAEAGFRAAKLSPTKYGGTTGAYGSPGALYGAEPPKVDVGRAAGVDPKAAQFGKQVMSNRGRNIPITPKQQYMKEANRLAQLKKDFGTNK